MRRTALRLLLAIVGVPIALLAHATSVRPQVARLIGTWRSDRERTIAHWKFPSEATTESRAKVASWFGHFTYTFTAQRVKATFDGGSWEAKYRVTSATNNSLTLAVLHPEEQESMSLYFDGQSFFIRSGKGSNFEYFERAEA